MYWPDKMVARLTMQMAVVTQALLKRIPSCESLSMFGVITIELPIQPSEFQRRSSASRKTTFILTLALATNGTTTKLINMVMSDLNILATIEKICYCWFKN
jgi:hypothetical protein